MHNLSGKIKNIIAAGCSFTKDGIGGFPPTPNDPGTNNFLDRPKDGYNGADPKSWASMIAKELAVDSMVNVAASSHGNILLSNSIFSLLQDFRYDPEVTLILFNISEPTRLDIPCDFDHHDASKFIPWSKEIIKHSYLSYLNNTLENTKREVGPDAISCLTSSSLWLLMDFLRAKGYKFAFMTMADYTQDQYLGPLIKRFNENFLKLDQWNSMKEFCVHNNLTVSEKDMHPSVIGHQQIADRMSDFLHRSSRG